MSKINYHIVVAAGTGSRYGGNLPKQFCDLGGRPLLMTTLERLHAAAPDGRIILVVSREMEPVWAQMCCDHSFCMPLTLVHGGASRAESVKNAVMTIDPATVGWISVHDAARPLVTPEMFGRLLEGLRNADGAIPAVAVTDSLRELTIDGRSHAVDRSRYRAVQTPQLFHGNLLVRANLQELRPEFTDDASVMEAAGFSNLKLVEGDTNNIKVTNPGDIQRIEAILEL